MSRVGCWGAADPKKYNDTSTNFQGNTHTHTPHNKKLLNHQYFQDYVGGLVE